VKLERIKKLSLKTYAIALIIAFFVGLVLGGAIVYSQSSNENITIVSGSFTETASYIIFKVGDTIYAKNGTTGEIEFSGTDASQVIQSAINALSNGGKIFFKRGTYEISSSILAKSNIEIVGEGEGTILKMQDNANLIFGIIKIYYERSNVKIRNLVLDGNKAGQTDESYCIAIRRSSNILIESCTLKNAYTAAIRFYTASGETKNNKIIIRNNIFEDNNCDIYDDTYGSEDVVVIGNIFSGADEYSIRIFNSDRWIVAKNRFILKNEGVEFVTSGAMNQIIGNTFVWSENPPTYARAILLGAEASADKFTEKFIVSDNVIDGTGTTAELCGIYMHGYNGQPTVRDGTITGNVIINMTYGIVATYPSHIDIISNTIKDCDKGIRLVSCSYNKICDNIIVECETGVSEESLSDHNVIESNYIINSTTAIVKVGANTEVRRNKGYITENSGTATISAGSTSVTVNHGLAGTPTVITVTPSADIGDVWVDSVTSTSFTIHCETAPSSDVTVYWYAEYKP